MPTYSVWKGLKFVIWENVNDPKKEALKKFGVNVKNAGIQHSYEIESCSLTSICLCNSTTLRSILW